MQFSDLDHLGQNFGTAGCMKFLFVFGQEHLTKLLGARTGDWLQRQRWKFKTFVFCITSCKVTEKEREI